MKMKKLMALIMGLAIAVTAVGCGGARSTVEIDDSKTTLIVGNYNGGVGYEWLNAAIEKFEEKYADTSFEEGKKGVQVIIGSNNKTSMQGDALEKTILGDGSKDEVFFTEGVFYHKWVKDGKFLDITEAVNADLSEFGEEGSIADKLDEGLLKSLKVEDKIYALPFWQDSYCMVYNATLFDEEEWYIAEDGSYCDASGNLGAGPDGEKGTYDDGMPATYDEFFALLEEIGNDNATPIQMPGASLDYVSWMIAEMAANNMGYDQMMLNYTFEGEAELVKTDSINYETLEYKTEKVNISPVNAYELARQPGLLQAVAFADKLLKNTEYYDQDNSLSGSFKVTQSQLEFVRNPTVSGKTNVAIMIDGFWWENEASAAFKETYGTNATKYDSEMEYKVMPFPKATKDAVGTENIMIPVLNTYAFIKSNIAPEKVEVATKFLQFVHTDAQMEEFTNITGLMKPYSYDVDVEGLTPFAQSMVEMMQDSRVALPMDSNSLFTYSPSDFRLVRFVTTKYAGDQAESDGIAFVLTQIKQGKYMYTLEDYYKGIINYRKDIQWKQYDEVLK